MSSRINNNNINYSSNVELLKSKSIAKKPATTEEIKVAPQTIETKDGKNFSSSSEKSSDALSSFDLSLDDDAQNTSNDDKSITLHLNKLPPSVSKELFEKHTSLKESIFKDDIKTIAEAKKVCKNLIVFSKELNSFKSLFNSQETKILKNDLDTLSFSISKKLAKEFNMEVSPIIVNGRFFGINSVSKDGKPLTEKQKEIANLLKDTFKQIQKIKESAPTFRVDYLALAKFKDALLDSSIEKLSTVKDDKFTQTFAEIPDYKQYYKDIEGISTAIDTIDKMMESNTKIPTNLLVDLEQSVNKIVSAPLGKVAESLNGLSPEKEIMKNVDSLSKQLGTIDLSKNKQGAKDLIEQLDLELKKLDTSLPNIPNLQKQLDSLSKIKDMIDTRTLIAKNLIKDLNKNVQDLGKNVYLVLNNRVSPANLLVDALSNTPNDLSINNVINSYSKSMNALSSKLPPLYFPITTRRPLTYDDGKGNSFIIPAGSSIKSNGNQGYTINAPSMLMKSGNTIIETDNANIKTGTDSDKLSFNSLSINSDNADTKLTGFDAQIDKQNGPSYIKANNATVDLANGHVSLDKAVLIQDNNTSKLKTDSFIYEVDDTKAGFSDFDITQTKTENGSSLTGTASSLNVDNPNTLIKADNLSFDITKNGNAETSNFTGTNIVYKSADGVINVGSGNLNVLKNEDGSSNVKFTLKDSSFDVGKSKLTVVGDSDIEIVQNSEGKITGLTAKGNDINYTDVNGNAVKATNGVVNFAYDENGNLQGVSGQTNSLNFVGAKGDNVDVTKGDVNLSYDNKGNIKDVNGSFEKLNIKTANGDILKATGSDISANYENGILKSASGKSANVDFQSVNGDKINITDGQAKFNYDENGDIKDLNGSAKDLNYTTAKGDVLKANGTDISANYENGILRSASGKTATLDYQTPNGDKLNLTDGKANINYDENGNIKDLNGSAKDLNITTVTGDVIKANGTDVSIAYDNGVLKNASAKTGTLDYQGANGDKLNLTDGKVNINYDENGNIKDANGSIKNLDIKTANGDVIKANGTDVSVAYENGVLKNASAKTGTLDYTSAKGDKLNLTDGKVNINYDESGNIKDANGSIKNLNFTTANGDIIKANGIGVSVAYDNGVLKNASAKVGTLAYENPKGDKLNLTDGKVNINYDENGNIKDAKGSIKNLDVTTNSGDIIKASGTNVSLAYDNGILKNASAKTGTIAYENAKGDKLNLTDGKVNINYDENGNIKDAKGSIKNLDITTNSGDIIKASGTDVSIAYDNGVLKNASAKVGTLAYENPKGDKLNLTDGKVNINYDDKGNIKDANGSIKNLDVTTNSGDIIKASGTNVSLAYDNGVLKNATAGAGLVNYENSTGDKLNLTNGNVNLNYDEKGSIKDITSNIGQVDYTSAKGDVLTANGINSSIKYNNGIIQNASVDSGAIDYKTSDGNLLKLTDGNVNLNYDEKGNLKDATSTIGKVDLTTSDGNNIIAKGIETNFTPSNTDGFLKVHVDSAELKKQLSDELNVTVENIDLIVDKTATGALKDVDLQMGSLAGKASGMDVLVKTQNGERLRLNMKPSEDGSFIQNVFLQIPTGGEVEISNKDYDVKLGENQKFTFSQDGKGVYSLKDENININATTKDATVKVQGGNAEIKLDANSGDLIIENITGTHLEVNSKGQKVNIDIDKIKGFIPQAAGFSNGTTTGLVIRLKPTSDSSVLTAEVSSKVYGFIPVSLKFENVHDLEVSASGSLNQAHVYIGDRSGRGKVELGIGPIKSQGSALEFLTRYNSYNPKRMVSVMDNYLSKDDIKLGHGLSIGANSQNISFNAETTYRGLYAGFSMMFNNPSIMEGKFDTKQFSMGGIGEIGIKGRENKGNLFLGLVPGSYISIDQLQGKTTLLGIPLPKHMTIPTTAVGGFGFTHDSKESRFDMNLYGYANPAGFVPDNNFIYDQTKFGFGTGVSYASGSSQFKLTGIVDFNKEDKVNNYNVSASYSYKF